MARLSEPLAARIEKRKLKPGELAVWWLGGGGFCFKTSDANRIYIDPYLSDIVNEIFGQERAFPTPISAQDVKAELLLATHWHEDHLDPGSIPVIARQNPTATLVMPPSAMSRAVSWGVPKKQIRTLRAGESFVLRELKFQA